MSREQSGDNQQQETADSGLESLVVVAAVHDVTANPQHLRHKFQGKDGAAAGFAEIVRAARDLGLKARLSRSDWQGLQNMPLPAIAQHHNGRFFVLAKVTGDKALVLDSARGQPQTISREEFEQAWNGRLILVARRAGLGRSFREFDFSWFVPAILKYRKLLIEVLVASFFLQLFALLTPLFFQVVIDKVLVHQALTTLSVLAIGLLGLSVFLG
ncbi:MAG TPA: type I secretion system permease/ATPase, partial [Porticoccaceae bacterium]|nr:type I secretion system permease/ATPase [Porticoccaceae bacterium]